MGGGDLNSKKAWHPNTMKNQERVWKAEKAAAEEKKKILDLERERAQERDRDELNKLSKQNNRHSKNEIDHQLHWMYNKPDKRVQNEDYLLGKSIEKNYDSEMKSEQNEIPAVARRVVGSSMTTSTADNMQVDLARKLREDPLLLVKERERAARAALLNNPIQRRKLTELLRKEQEQKKAKSEQGTKKKTKKDLDEMLTAKLNALGKGKLDLAKLLESDDSSSDSSCKAEKKKTKKKKKKKDKKKKKQEEKCSSDSESQMKRREREDKGKSRLADKQYSGECLNSSKDKDLVYPYDRKRHRADVSESSEVKKQLRRGSPDRKYDYDRYKKDKYSSKEFYHKNERKDDRTERKRAGLSEEEKAAKFAEMAAAGKEREVERSQRVAKQRLEIASDEKNANKPRYSHHRSEARALPDSLQSRIHSNRHYIQRDHRHMNENFAKR